MRYAVCNGIHALEGEAMQPPIQPEQFRAVLFDLDGVLTDTAKVHATCWKRMFDDFLRQHTADTHIPFQPFDLGNDYQQYVDGKPRFDGVRSFRCREGFRDQLLEVDIEPNSVTYLLRQGSELVIAHQGEDVKLSVGHPVLLEIKAL
jgi:phosphoglycolate phosphatase-like HAD superfamily hydrolase